MNHTNCFNGARRGPFATALFFVLLFAIGSGGAIHAQTSPDHGTFIAVPDEFPDVDARAMLVREPGRDIVLLRSTEVTLDALAMSLLVLDRVRDRQVGPGQGQLIPITGFVMTNPPVDDYRERLVGALARLARAPVADLGSVGHGRWIRFR